MPYTAYHAARHWWRIPRPPHAPAARLALEERSRPDIYLFYVDGCDLTSAYLDARHYPDATKFPNLHRFVREDAQWFYNAVSNGPSTSTSAPSMFTGKLYASRWNNYLSNEETIFSILKPRYSVRTYLHTKSCFCIREDFELCYPFQEQSYAEPMRILFESWFFVSSFRLSPISYAIDMLDEASYDRGSFVDDFLTRLETDPESPKLYTIQLFDRELDGLRAFDRFFGDVVRILTAKGRYDSSILVLMSDHGFNYENAKPSYGVEAAPTPRLYRVPFAIKLPGRGGGQTHDFVAQGIDIAPTILARVLDERELQNCRFDGVDVLSAPAARDHYVNLFAPGTLFKFVQDSDTRGRLIPVPVSQVRGIEIGDAR
jgi:hypothetical protein